MYSTSPVPQQETASGRRVAWNTSGSVESVAKPTSWNRWKTGRCASAPASNVPSQPFFPTRPRSPSRPDPTDLTRKMARRHYTAGHLASGRSVRKKVRAQTRRSTHPLCHPERNRRWSEGPAVPSVPYRREAPLNQCRSANSSTLKSSVPRRLALIRHGRLTNELHRLAPVLSPQSAPANVDELHQHLHAIA
jgi:hypothetical protein